MSAVVVHTKTLSPPVPLLLSVSTKQTAAFIYSIFSPRPLFDFTRVSYFFSLSLTHCSLPFVYDTSLLFIVTDIELLPTRGHIYIF